MRHILNFALKSFLLLVFILMGIATVIHADQEVDPYKVKAVFLYNFAKFVDWPAGVFVNEDQQMVICVLGNDPFGPQLENIKDKTVKGKKITIRRLESVSQIKGKDCKILFVSGSEREKLQRILGTLSNLSVLTVGDTQGFAEAGIMINFYTDKNKIRLEINLEAAKRAGLKINSDLLKLARII